MIERILEHLTRLVGFDTTNPPRAIDSGGIVAYTAEILGDCGFSIEITDLGDGCLCVLGRRGVTGRLFNVHLDTVPATGAWSRDPFALAVPDGRASGLGACDIKGAAAALLTAAETTRGPASILLTTDEEAGGSRCVREFVATHADAFDGVVVAEPTECRTVTSHRGIVSAQVEFTGRAGHASGINKSAIHDAARWAAAAIDDRAAASALLNIGVLEGGTKANICAASCRAVFGFRPWSVDHGDGVMQELIALADHGKATWTTRFTGPALEPTSAQDRLAALLGASAGDAVDFWTEAALFAAGGIPAVVFGPGSITQAHAADEWVAVDQLETAARVYATAFDRGHADANSVSKEINS